MSDGELTSNEAGELVTEREFLLTSIADLDREHRAGDVGDEDYAQLRARYVKRAARTLRALEEDDAPRPTYEAVPAKASNLQRVRRYLGRRRVRRVLVLVAALCLLCTITIVILGAAGVRLPGASATGSISLPLATEVRQQLTLASSEGTVGDVPGALELYSAVLSEIPNQPEALTNRAWLVRLTGKSGHSAKLVREGDEELASAVLTNPKYGPAHGLYGLALVEDGGSVRIAVRQFNDFIADHPDSAILDAIGPQAARAYITTHLSVPKAFRAFAPKSAGKGSS